ncbi:putative mus7 mms22 family protein [Golovinomyces cichoracearum]|uniref:Putative mus7 mms22 family protein n=1 Tax=Golovinomyces cichoracearum TaxID=62708 RepID=A0A420HFD6_9PEZI|nr:putative mus7 mms22 family protein [Golovinomyces cichoracearum]
MTNWKEKGYVPGSDDENELDCKENINLEENELNQFQNIDSKKLVATIEELFGDEDCGKNQDSEENYSFLTSGLVEPTLSSPPSVNATSSRNNFKLPSPELVGGCGNSQSQLIATEIAAYLQPDTPPRLFPEGSQKTSTRKRTLQSSTLNSSPLYPKVFKVPTAFWEENEDDDLSAATTHEDPLVPDDISTSYVQVNSPVSSVLSSVPSSLPDVFEYRPPSPTSDKVSKDDFNKMQTTRPSVAVERELYTHEESIYPMKRALRHRNLIQLHPYIVEQEKYRQALKARGMIPLMTSQSQDDRGRRSYHSASPGYGTADDSLEQLKDSYVSQTNKHNFTSSLFPFEAIETCNDINCLKEFAKSDSLSQDEEQFPTVNELMGKKTIFSPISETSQRIDSTRKKRKDYYYSSRKSSSIQTARFKTNDIKFNRSTPKPQPFLTSQPKESHGHSTARRLSESLPGIAEDDSEMNITAETSPDYISIDASPVGASVGTNINFDADDPFVSDLSESSSTNSTSDESMMFRKVRKKIRGVLPASHLRLNPQSEPQIRARASRDTLKLSSLQTNLSRKGIAFPKSRGSTTSHRRLSSSGLQFIADESDKEDDKSVEFNSASLKKKSSVNNFDHLSKLKEQGTDIEDNSIYYAYHSRNGRTFNKLEKVFEKSNSGVTGQHILQTTNLKRPHAQVRRLSRPSKRLKRNVTNQTHKNSHSCPPKTPRLSILDVIDSTENPPTFIKIATRTVRSKKCQGRHSPSCKFIRLSTIEDTQDAKSVLADWRTGKIAPKSGAEFQVLTKTHTINSSKRTLSSKNFGKSSGDFQNKNMKLREHTNKKKNVQLSMDYFVNNEQEEMLYTDPHPHDHSSFPELTKRNMSRTGKFPRPAQLESSHMDHDLNSHFDSLKFSKKSLDRLHTALNRQPTDKYNAQISRFLNDENFSQNSKKISNIKEKRIVDELRQLSSSSLTRRRKRTPKRVDAGAARYRQLSDPLVLDVSSHEKEDIVGQECKLLGLGKLGTKYPINFNIFPLHQGTFFHHSTFIGSGRLRDSLQGDTFNVTQISPENISLNIGEKIFSWCTWNEVSASEMGVCFDLLSDSLLENKDLMTSPVNAREIIMFVLNYAQHIFSFNQSLDQKSFLSRATKVLQEFTTRLDPALNAATVGLKHKAIVLPLCSVLVFHLLKLARTDYGASFLILDLEELLKKITSQCASVLILEGFDSIRKIYEDLQYHSYREAGLGDNQQIAEGWVIVMKVLNKSLIPRGSFWDLINCQLRLNEVEIMLDAISMENLWYCMHSLLPLCEFDDLGHIVPGQRENISFENWTLPQHLLKRVFTLYKSNDRQPSGFNEYCRALFHRCHYLMAEWGWRKSSSFIGFIFDFFAAQNLSNLRNEEVYHSPSFLENLNAEPSLAIEPGDCCFHIFLKMVALEFKYLSQKNDAKSIRNLGPRLLPNHDRQYPKEENIHQRDLASLRNHHDLLCTLFWLMPQEQRPSITLIQGLVIPDRSHREACMINLQSWENLTRFLVTSSVNPNHYLPFKNWQSTFFFSIHKQFNTAETEVRQQADDIFKKTGNSLTEIRISETILANKTSIIFIMCRSVKAMGNTIKAVKCDQMMKQALNCDVLSKALDPYLHAEDHLSNLLLTEVFQVLKNSMDQTNRFYPSVSNELVYNIIENWDSQESIDINNWSRLEMISLLEILCNCLKNVLKMRINNSASKIHENPIIAQLVDCWGRLISIITENDFFKFQSNFISDSKTVFDNRHICSTVNYYWQLFLAKLLQYGKLLDDFKVLPGFDIGLEWLLSLIEVEAISMPNVILTFQLQQKGYFLCATPDMHKLDRSHMIRAAICKMSNILIENSSESETGLTQKQARRHFSQMLGEVLKSMQKVLETLDPNTERHRIYLNFARSVITNIKRYASDFRHLTEFFIHPSAHYWPHDADPNLYVAGIVSYCVRLSKQPEKTSFELFYYLHNGWMNAVINDRLEEYTNYIEKGMKRKEFTQFMLSEFIPVILEVGFSMDGWLLCNTFLPTIKYRIFRILETSGPDSAWALEQFLNILKIIYNGTSNLIKRFPNELRGAHPDHRGILAVLFQFWMQNSATIRQYMERHPHMTQSIRKITDPLTGFIFHALRSFERNEMCQNYPFSKYDFQTGKYHNKFITFFTREISECWQFSDESHFQVVIKSRSRESSKMFLFENTLKEVLCGEIAIYESLFEYREDMILIRGFNSLIEKLML